MSDDPQLLYSVPKIRAYHIQDGEETELTPSGPQTMSLLMVPMYSDEPSAQPAENDYYLHLNLPPEVDLPLLATTRIYRKRPCSYLIRNPEPESGSSSYTRIEFPPLGRGVQQEDIDTFETILAQCTAFMERAHTPEKAAPKYNPSEFKPGEAYAMGTGRVGHGQVILVDEVNGGIVGEIAEDAEIIEHPLLTPGDKDPVEITISADGKHIQVKPLSEDYLEMARNPAYASSTLVQKAAAASRLIVTTSDHIASALAAGANKFNATTKPQKPVNFSPSTHKHVRKINKVTTGAAALSERTVGQVAKIAQNVGASVARRGGRDGKSDSPGLLNKSMIAFSTLADGLAVSGKHLLGASGDAATAMLGHRYGDDARKVAAELTHSVTNVGLVYIDVTGVSRRAVLRSVAKGMLVGKVKGGGKVLVGDGDGGVVPADAVNGPDVAALGRSASFGSAKSSAAIVAAAEEPPTYSPADYKPAEYKPADYKKHEGD